MEKGKTILIPGWMNGVGMYAGKGRLYEILEVWKDRVAPEKEIDAERVIAHSLGCNYALLNWEKNKNTKLILVNPLIPKRNIFSWFLRWRRFHQEEDRPENKEVISGLRKRLFGLKICWRLLRYDFDAILENIPKKDIVVVCGESDVFYCDEKMKDYVRSKNIKLVEVNDAGHEWNEKFDEVIEETLK